jgi:hypothetical protein
MSRFVIIAFLTAAWWTFTTASVDAQYRTAWTNTRHVAVGPMGGISTGQTHTTAHVGPLGSSSSSVHTGTKVTPSGATVQYGQAAGARSGPFGASAGSAHGVKVTTPTGQSYSHASSSKVAAGPGGVAVSGASRTTTSGPFGTAGAVRAGGAFFR